MVLWMLHLALFQKLSFLGKVDKCLFISSLGVLLTHLSDYSKGGERCYRILLHFCLSYALHCTEDYHFVLKSQDC